MKKDYMEMDVRLYQWEVEDIVTLSAGAFDEAKDDDLVSDDIFND